jgi:hypothetical protein
MNSQRIPRSLAFAAAILLVAACSATSGDLGPIATPPPSAAPSVEPASPEPTSGAETPSPTPAGTPVPSPTAGPIETTTVRAYFLRVSAAGHIDLVPVLREIPKTQAVATAAMNALLAGPDETERTADPELSTTIPTGTRLLGLSVADGVATVDLSREFESGGGSASVFGRLAQVVYTLTQFPTVQSVLFQLDGEPVTVFSGEGVILDHAVGRADYTDQLPAIWVDRPAWGAALGNPGRITGLANVFEATFRVAILDADGDTLVDEMVMASCGTGCWGTFDVTVRYTVTAAEWGTLRVYELSTRDGSPINVADYPVWLTLAG